MAGCVTFVVNKLKHPPLNLYPNHRAMDMGSLNHLHRPRAGLPQEKVPAASCMSCIGGRSKQRRRKVEKLSDSPYLFEKSRAGASPRDHFRGRECPSRGHPICLWKKRAWPACGRKESDLMSGRCRYISPFAIGDWCPGDAGKVPPRSPDMSSGASGRRISSPITQSRKCVGEGPEPMPTQ